MHIAIAARIPLHHNGGVHRVMESLAQGFRQRGHEVDLVFNLWPIMWIDFLLFPFYLFIRSLFSSWDVIIAHSSDGALCALASKFSKRLPDVYMHSHGWEQRAFEAWKEYGLQYGGGPSLLNRIIAQTLRFSLLRLSLTFCQGAVFVSEMDKAWVQRKIPCSQPKIYCIPNGVDLQLFYEQELWEKNAILFVGNLTWKKGSRFLKPVLFEIFKNNPASKVILAGLGISKEKQEQIFEGPNFEQLEFFDNLDPDKMSALYHQSTILLCASVFEGFSLTVLEALASGLPIVSFAYPGLSDFLESGKEAILVKSGDWQELARQVLLLLKDPERQKRISRAGIEKVREYAWSRQIVKWENLLKRIVYPNKETV